MAFNAHEEGKMPRVEIVMEASAARAQGDLVAVSDDGGGLVDATVADANAVQTVAVAAHAIASGAKGIYVLRGDVVINTPSITTVAGQGLKYNNGAIAATGAALFNGKSLGDVTSVDFAVCQESSTGTTHLVTLIGVPFTTTT